ncbi:MAG: 2-octaprenyl-6-methoxyphenyl hydroxylase [Rhodanobacter sp.]
MHTPVPAVTNPRSVLVVGGGLVGASLAIALDAAGMAVTLVEASAPRVGAQPSYDERNLALANASVNGLRSIGVWPHAQSHATPIRQVRVSRAGDFGSTRIDARQQGVAALGWTLPARLLGAALLQRLDACSQLTRLAPATLVALDPLADGWRAHVRGTGGEQQMDTALVVGADGSESFVRATLGIEVERHDYRQTLFVSTVTPEHDPAGRAFERFSDDGPVALLPLADGHCGLVLTVPTGDATRVAALDDAAYLALAQRRFGWTLGRLSRPGRRHPYAVQRVVAASLIARHAVLVGNAAQTIHPIGAQGFNLGLRDALTLAEMIAPAMDAGAAELLRRYAARRAPDREGTMAMSHGLVQLACLHQPLLGPVRSLALLACDRLPPLQRALARRGMGFRGEPPRSVLEPLG